MGSRICVQLLSLLDDIASGCQAPTRKEDLKEGVSVPREVKCSCLKYLDLQEVWSVLRPSSATCVMQDVQHRGEHALSMHCVLAAC